MIDELAGDRGVLNHYETKLKSVLLSLLILHQLMIKLKAIAVTLKV